MVGLSNLLRGSYEIPMVSEDFNISLYFYGKDSIHEILTSEASHFIPDDFPPLMEDREHFCLDTDHEFSIFINCDVCPESERIYSLVECLFHAGCSLETKMESEEFGARVIAAAFEFFVPFVEDKAPTTTISIPENLVVEEFPLPLVSKGYSLTLNLFDDATTSAAIQKLKSEYREKMLSGEFNPTRNNGFVVKPNTDELAIFINCDSGDTEHHRLVLIHELYHAASDICNVFDSIELGGKLYKAVFKKFSKVFE